MANASEGLLGAAQVLVRHEDHPEGALELRLEVLERAVAQALLGDEVRGHAPVHVEQDQRARRLPLRELQQLRPCRREQPPTAPAAVPVALVVDAAPGAPVAARTVSPLTVRARAAAAPLVGTAVGTVVAAVAVVARGRAHAAAASPSPVSSSSSSSSSQELVVCT